VQFITEQQVAAMLDLDELIEALGPAMRELSAGEVVQPPRLAINIVQPLGFAGFMPSFRASSGLLCTKAFYYFPGTGPLRAYVQVFDTERNELVALMEASYLTAARTAAGSALATRLLTRPDADVCLIIGTGVQAAMHAKAIPRVRRLKELRITGRDMQKAAALAAEVKATAVPYEEAAFRGAGIVCGTTHADEPIVRGAWLDPGTHVNSVGHHPKGRELDDEVIRRGFVAVESRAAALLPPPAGTHDLLRPIAAGLIKEEDLHEIGTIRARPDADITVYKSVGVAIQDAVAAGLVLAALNRSSIST
jgi:alanine dehydrogenase